MLMEAAAAEARFERAQERTVRDMGFGDTEPALKMAEALLPRVVAAIEAKKLVPIKGSPFFPKFLKAIESLDANAVALCAIQMAFHQIAVPTKNHVREVSRAIGSALDDEMYGVFFHKIDPRSMRAVEKRVAKKHGSRKYRVAAIKSMIKRKGLQRPRHLTQAELAQGGGWLLETLLEALPDVFAVYEMRSKKGPKCRLEKFLTVTDDALAQMDEIAAWHIKRNPVYIPQTQEPEPWTALRQSDGKNLVRAYHNETKTAIKAAIESGQMQPALDAINRVQSVPFMINKKVLEAQQFCIEHEIAVKGLPPAQPLPLPEKPRPWEEMSEAERRLWRKKADKTQTANRAFVGQRVNLTSDVETAKYLAGFPAFWMPHSIDWRGRLYPFPHFNFQREDRVRGLLLFRNGQPIGERGLWWLKVHTANCGDFDKVSKKSFEERVAWVDTNLQWIKIIASNPTHYLDWMRADKPFLFLAACIELAAALDEGPTFITHLPVSWDGSCSGLQHLSAMSRAEEGAFVNLTVTEQPQDVYQRVADVARCSIKSDDDPLADLCLANGVDRKLVKRNVMTFPYSATKFGMGLQHVEDTMEPLTLKVLAGELPSHPYGDDNGQSASVYLAKHVHAAIQVVVRKPAQVMAFLQDLARVMAHEGKPVSWVTPAGLPWCNRYHPIVTKQVKLWLHDKGVRVGYTTVVANGNKKEIDKRRAESAVAPNFVHACDANHLMLTVNAAHAAGIHHFALVHDSFGCLASQSEDMHRIIREQFVSMYEHHDVLAEVLAQCKCDLTSHNHDRLPVAIEYGSLDIKGVLDARYAFA